MAQQPKRSSSLLQFLLIFAIVYLGSEFVIRTFFPRQFGGQKPPVGIELQAPAVRWGNNPAFTVRNDTSVPFPLESRCPLPPVDVFRLADGSNSRVPLTPAGTGSDAALRDRASQNAVPCQPPPVVPPGGSAQVSLSPWKYGVFGGTGSYLLRLPVPAGVRAAVASGSGRQIPAEGVTAVLQVTQPGFFTKIFRTFISAPFLNFLIFVASLLPGHSLGIAIIVLTIVVKLLLYIPTQHALEGQKKMQMLQPKLEELKRKFPNDPQRVQEETMKLWKEHDVNPFQSCLPNLIQFPVLIGLLYVVRDESTLELSRHLIYPFYQHLSWHFGTVFLGLDLLQPNIYILPPLLVILQYLQMKLTFAIAERKESKENGAVIDAKGGKKKGPLSQTEVQQKVFLYALPLMIGFFALKFPAAVSIYWGVSTLFAIVQQIIVNREHLRV